MSTTTKGIPHTLNKYIINDDGICALANTVKMTSHSYNLLNLPAKMVLGILRLVLGKYENVSGNLYNLVNYLLVEDEKWFSVFVHHALCIWHHETETAFTITQPYYAIQL